jgi:thiol-disulfide isomerase/thioredoxin
MIKRISLAAVSLGALLGVLGYGLYSRNQAPWVSPVSLAEAANPTRPFVVKLHAQWCPLCMVTKDEWQQIAATYAGRVNLVVLDFTNQASTDASRVEAGRLGLGAFFDEYEGVTGTVVILDGRTKTVTGSIHGSREFAEYRAAIDASLSR